MSILPVHQVGELLMPMVSHDDEAEWSAEELGTYLRDLITEHAALNIQKVSLRLVDQFFRFLARGKPFEDSEQPEHKAFALGFAVEVVTELITSKK
jgi:hypothetical protein